MDTDTRQRKFLEAVQQKVGFSERQGWKSVKLWGISNRAVLIEGGLQIGDANVQGWRPPIEKVILSSFLRFPPADEIYFSVVIEHNVSQILDWLQFMLEKGRELAERPKSQVANRSSRRLQDTDAANIGLFPIPEEEDNESVNITQADTIEYAQRNNNVRFYLADDGKLYLGNKDFWENLTFNKEGIGPAIEVDRILLAVYPPTPSTQRSLFVRDFVGYFATLVGREKIEEIQPWPDEASTTLVTRRTPQSVPLSELTQRIQKLGRYFTTDLLSRYHISLNHLEHKHFVILTGLSGTGKTSLAKSYAYAVHGIEDQHVRDPFFYMCPVRPDWTDPTGLTGYYDVINGKYIVPPFLQAILIATAYKDTPVFVCIDEMNIARPEFYFSDMLSSMESGSALSLHSNAVPFEGNGGEQVPSQIELPSNLYITGTVNVDESTQPLSDKILDRANVIDTSSINIEGFLTDLGGRVPTLLPSIGVCSPLLIALEEKLQVHSLGFGYRVAEEIVRYFSFSHSIQGVNEVETLDSQVTQKILVKLRGGERQRELLEQLTVLLKPYLTSVNVVADLSNQLNEYGSFQYLR